MITLDQATVLQIEQANLEKAVQQYMDSQAQTRGYDSIFTATTYATESAVPKFQNEGIAFRAWRSNVWNYCYGLLAQVQAGTIPIPTATQLIANIQTNVPLVLPP